MTVAETERRLEVAPSSGLEPETDGSARSDDGLNPTGPYGVELKKLRHENGKWRQQARELEARVEELSTKLESASSAQKELEQAKLAEQEQWKTLAEQRSSEIEEWKSRLKAETGKAHQHLIAAHVRGLLAGEGVTDRDVQDVLLPGIVAKAKAKVGKDFTIEGEFDELVAKVAAGFGKASEPEQATRPSSNALRDRLASVIPGQMPTDQPSDPRARQHQRRTQLLEQMKRAVKA